MAKVAAFFLVFTWSVLSFAEQASIVWPTRNSKVICGGEVDGKSLNMRISVEGEVLAGESDNGRVLIFVDLHKPGQVHWIFSDALTDDQYEKREAAMAKLSAEEAGLIRSLTAMRETDLYMGMTDGFVTLRTASKTQVMSMSCQEISLSVSK